MWHDKVELRVNVKCSDCRQDMEISEIRLSLDGLEVEVHPCGRCEETTYSNAYEAGRADADDY